MIKTKIWPFYRDKNLFKASYFIFGIYNFDYTSNINIYLKYYDIEGNYTLQCP